MAVDMLNFDTVAFDNICAELGLTGFYYWKYLNIDCQVYNCVREILVY